LRSSTGADRGECSLEDLRAKKTLWKEAGIEAVFISDYKVSIGDISATKIAKESAIQKAARTSPGRSEAGCWKDFDR
jgi:hypothetical protein